MKQRLLLVIFGTLLGISTDAGLARACKFTPLEWQQPIEKHAIVTMVGQRKHVTWTRDRNRNFIDDELEVRFRKGELVNVVVDFNACLTPSQIREVLGKFGRLTYISKLISFAVLEDVRFDDLPRLSALPQVAMVEWGEPGQIMNDVATRAVQSRASNTFSPSTAQDAGFTGTGINIAILDTGVDNNHQAFTGKFVGGFNAAVFEDTNGNGVDDSCEPAPLGNGSCADADDEPGNGTTNPADNQGHGSHVAGIALGAIVAGTTCSTPDDGSGTNCAGVAQGAGLVDIRVCTGTSCPFADQMEGLDWLAINARTFNIRVANMSIGGCTNDDGTGARAQQVNYAVALGVTMVVAHGNSGNCGVLAGTMLTGSPGSASFAITVAAINDRDTVRRNDDTNYTQFLRGPRIDFNVASPNLLALKPDVAAPGENIFSVQRNTATGYFSNSGTSMASPSVAGAAAVVLQARPNIDPASLKDLLLRNADTTQNAAQFPAVDPNWDNDLGNGMLNVWTTVNAAAAADVRFPNCIGPGVAPGQPCTLTAPMPPWNNTADITTATAPKVGVANTITAQVRNDGPAQAVVRVSFGVYVFAAGNNRFFDVGTQQVTIPAGTTVAVNQPWTPAAANHQCAQVSIAYGFDTNFGDNITQRNLQVAPSVFEVQIENPFKVAARIELRPRASKAEWRCRISEESFTLDPFQDCPRKVRVNFDPPAGARAGDRAECEIAVFAIPKGDHERRMIGGVTVQTFVPQPCRVVGEVVDLKDNPVAGARLTFTAYVAGEQQPGEGGEKSVDEKVRPVSVLTDADGIFSLQTIPFVSQRVTIEKAGFAKGQIEVRASCGAGTLKFRLGREGVQLVER